MKRSRVTGAWLGGLVLLAACVWSGCGGKGSSDSALVRVGDTAIGESELRAYKEKLASTMQPTVKGEAAIRELLQALVDRRLMLVESHSKGHDRDSVLVERLLSLQRKELQQLLLDQEVAPQAQVSEAEVRQAYTRDHWDQEHWPAHILSATEEDARQVIKTLEQGADFAELARQRSIAPDAAHGGDLRGYFGLADAATPIAEAVVGQPEGSIIGPVATRDGYEVIKVLSVRPVPFETVQAKLSRGLAMQKAVQERFKLLERLEPGHEVVYHSEGVAALVAAANRQGRLAPDQEGLPLISLGGRAYLATGEGYRQLLGARRSIEQLNDSLKVVRSLRARVLADTLLVREAQRRGFEQTPEYRTDAQRRFERLMVDYLYKTEILDKLQVSEGEVVQAYQGYQAQFVTPARAELTEILVPTEAEGRDLAARIRSGADMADLSRRHSRRALPKNGPGTLMLPEGEMEYGKLFHDLVLGAEVGKVVGPVAVEGGYSIFRVERRIPAGLIPLDQARDVLVWRVKKHKAQEAFNAFISDLRERYASQVKWNDGAIEALAATGAW